MKAVKEKIAKEGLDDRDVLVLRKIVIITCEMYGLVP